MRRQENELKTTSLAQNNSGPARGNPSRHGRNTAPRFDNRGPPGNASFPKGNRGRGNPRPQHVTAERIAALFDKQRQLTQVVSRQAKLLKITAPEVRSVDSELLRQTNDSIVRLSAGLAEQVAPSGQYTTETFSLRSLSNPQIVFEDMIDRQGKRFEALSLLDEPSSSSPLRRRRNGRPIRENFPGKAPSNLFKLGGHLLRHYLRARHRGYIGGPELWLRSRYAKEAALPFTRRGIIFPPRRAWSIFDRQSPLHWEVTSQCKCELKSHTGFRGELTRRNMDFHVLSVQRSKVATLRRSQWPVDPRSNRSLWPSYPTISESWEAYLRHQDPPDTKGDVSGSTCRLTLSQVRNNPLLAKKVVSQNILGIRADVVVPDKYLAYFKYKWGFLILIRRQNLSIGVTRFLLAQWKKDRRELLQFKAVPLRKFLRECVPSSYLTTSVHKDSFLLEFFKESSLNQTPSTGGPGITRPSAPVRFVEARNRSSAPNIVLKRP